MLCEIYCKEFYQKKVEFNSGFNVVLGTKTGDNSIGKSTFMLIIDFVFGGNTYSDSIDILKNVGLHDICFKFEFNGVSYYFKRSNADRNIVWKCNSDYAPSESISNEAYCQWLSEQYGLNLYKLSFRDAVGRYMRVYGKKNCDENHPLHAVQSESSNKAAIALLKLFDCYKIIADLEDRAKMSNDELKTFEKAQKLEYIAKINKREYNKNQKEIKKLQTEIQELSTGLEDGLLDVDAEASAEAIQIKNQLSRAKRLRSGVKSRLSTLNENSDYKFSITTNTYTELEKFFPNVNLKHIEEVEVFHNKIASIFKDELKEEKINLNKKINEYDSIINDYEEQLKELIQNPKLSKIILKKYADALKNIEKMNNENNTYTQLKKLKRTKENDVKSLKTIKNEQFAILEKNINIEMERINNQIYQKKFNSPIIHFTDSSYAFTTPNDTGTGIAYKGMVVFDLAIMHLTQVPVLIHDSVVLKQISDNAIENIINQYIDCKKQVVIALDKPDSYSKKTFNMLDKYSVLKLAPNGQELFGRSWRKHD